MWESAAQDMRYAGRTLVRNPGFTAAATVVLALGIGANAAIFSAVNAFFFRPLPFGEAERLVTLYETNPEFGWDDANAAPANMLDWREQVDAFEDVSAFSDFTFELTTFRDQEPVVVVGTGVVGNFFETLGVFPAMGRTFRMEETWAGSDNTVVISDAMWRSHFGSDPDIVGKTLELSTSTPEIIGVMPPGFSFPDDETRLWFTMGWATEAREQVWFRRAHFVRAFARLAPGVSIAEADAQLQVVVERLQQDYPETNSVMGAGMTPIRDFLIKDVRTPLLVLLGAVGLLLLLACTNVATLMLVRANDRTREVALRHALGAGRARVARQMLTESGMLAVCGGLLGLALGWVGVKAIAASTPVGIDGATSLALDHRVVLFTLAASGLSAVLFGIAPTLRTMAGDVHTTLREGGRGSSSGRRGLRTVSALVSAEVALALLLVVGAGLMVRTFWSLRQVDPGFEAQGVLAVQVTAPGSRYQERDQVLAFYEQFAEALEGRPGVERVGLVGHLPLDGTSWSSQFQAEGWPPDRVGFEIIHRRADNAFFEAVETPLIRGRLFEPTDGPDDPLVVVVNETFAREHFPREDPIGQKIAYDREATGESTWYEIIGIVTDQHQVSPKEPARAEVFEHARQDWERTNWLVIRGDGDAQALIPAAQAVLAELDPMIPIARTRTLRDVWSESMAREAFVLTLLVVFGVLALVLASVGVYGVTAQAARRRTQEIGIRMALGAGAPDVLRMMLGRGLVVVGVGVAIGLATALVATRALTSLLYGVEPTDPATLTAVAALLGATALIASYLPARRATSVDPVESLRRSLSPDSRTSRPLLDAHGLQGIDTRGTPGRGENGQAGHDEQQDRPRCQTEGIRRAHPRNHAPDEPTGQERAAHAEHDSRHHNREAGLRHERQHFWSAGAQRQPDAHLSGAACHGVGDDRVDAHRRQDEGHQGEGDENQSLESGPNQLALGHTGEGVGRAQRGVRIGPLEGPHHGISDRRRLAVSPDEEPRGHPAQLPVGPVDLRVRGRSGRHGLHVGHHAHHLEAALQLRQVDGAAERVGIRPGSPREALVHDGHPRRAFVVVLGELSSPDHGQPQGLEEVGPHVVPSGGGKRARRVGPVDCERGGAVAAAEQGACRGRCRGRHAGDGLHGLFRLAEHRDEFGSGGVFARVQEGAHGHQRFSVEAGLPLQVSHEASREQSRAAQKHHGQREFG
jgi:putative ABC transport system permease protein